LQQLYFEYDMDYTVDFSNLNDLVNLKYLHVYHCHDNIIALNNIEYLQLHDDRLQTFTLEKFSRIELILKYMKRLIGFNCIIGGFLTDTEAIQYWYIKIIFLLNHID
jgi:hypothetical protein